MIRRTGHSALSAGLLAAQTLAVLLLASREAGGAVALQIALSFYFLPIALVATPVGLSLLPRLSRLAHGPDVTPFDTTLVQGLGAALFEKCVYDERGQLTNANMADYLVPMSGEMPDIDVGHVVSPTLETELGAKGAGEAGTAGAAAAVTNAVNDALRPFGTIITEIPLTPQVILTALGRI
jgi:hypothetical protein